MGVEPSKKSNIVIDLSKVREVTPLGNENIIHKRAFEKVFEILDYQLEQINNYNPSNSFRRVHNSILIDGGRGTGKTSFLLSIINMLRDYGVHSSNREHKRDEKSVDFQSLVGKIREEIYVMDILDPTLISTRQHVLLLVITLIKKAVERHLNNRLKQTIGSQIKPLYDIDNSDREILMRKLKNLAEGLNQIDQFGRDIRESDIWDDAMLVIDRGLRISEEGLNFERNFHIFVYESLRILGKKAFLFVFDDIDIDFSKGWELLETIRKYLTSPQLLLILAGNYELFNHIVRKNKWNLYLDLHKIDIKLKKAIRHQIDEISQQYLIKLLQPNHHIVLHKLGFYLIKDGPDLFIVRSDLGGEVKEKRLVDCFYEIFTKLYRMSDKTYLDAYQNLILSLPTRTVLQYLKINEVAVFGSQNSKLQEFDSKSILDIILETKTVFLSNFNNLGLSSDFFDLILTEIGPDLIVNEVYRLSSNFGAGLDVILSWNPRTDNVDLNLWIFFVLNYLNAYYKIGAKTEFLMRVTLPLFIYNILDREIKVAQSDTTRKPGRRFDGDLLNKVVNYSKFYQRFVFKFESISYILKDLNLLLLRVIRDAIEIANIKKEFQDSSKKDNIGLRERYKKLGILIEAVAKERGEKPSINIIDLPSLLENLRRTKASERDKINEDRMIPLIYILTSSSHLFFPGKGESYSYLSPLMPIYLFLLSLDRDNDEFIKSVILEQIKSLDREERTPDKDKENRLTEETENQEKSESSGTEEDETDYDSRELNFGLEIDKIMDLINKWRTGLLKSFENNAKNRETYEEIVHILYLNKAFLDYLDYAQRYNFFVVTHDSAILYFERAILNFLTKWMAQKLFSYNKLVKGIRMRSSDILRYNRVFKDQFKSDIFDYFIIHPLLVPYYSPNFIEELEKIYLKKDSADKPINLEIDKETIKEIFRIAKKCSNELKKLVKAAGQ